MCRCMSNVLKNNIISFKNKFEFYVLYYNSLNISLQKIHYITLSCYRKCDFNMKHFFMKQII